MAKKADLAFDDWLENHEFKINIKGFLDWSIENNAVKNPSNIFSKSSYDYFLSSLMRLDALSEFLVSKKILEYSLFKPEQFFNPNKLMHASSKSGVLAHILKDEDAYILSDAEEWMWYTMRLYSTYMDFLDLSEDESLSFEGHIDELEIPKNILRTQYILWTIMTVLLVAVSGALIYFSFVATASLLIAAAISVFAILGIVFWIIGGILKSFPSVFKKTKKEGELASVRGRIVAVRKLKPFSGIAMTSQSVFVAPLHGTLGKSFVFHSLGNIELTPGRETVEIVFLKKLDIIIDIRQIDEES